MKCKITLLIAILFLAVNTQAYAQKKLEDHPGYIDFKALGIGGGKEATVEVNLKGPLLRMMAAAGEEDDPELKVLLGKLEAIRIETYEMDSLSMGGFEKQAAAIAKRLEADGWETIVASRERGERANVCIKTDGDRIVGLVVMAVEKNDEAAFVNIVGDIDLAEISRLGSGLDIEPLDSLQLPAKKTVKSGKK